MRATGINPVVHWRALSWLAAIALLELVADFIRDAQSVRQFAEVTLLGLFVDVEPKVGDRGVAWSFEDPRLGRIRYTMRLTERGEWHEVGESSRDGSTWSTFFEATLRKVE